MFLKKNVLQTQTGRSFGYEYDVLTNDSLGLSHSFASEMRNLILLHSSIARRMGQVLFYFIQNFRQLHHVEIYPGGRFAFVYTLFCKAFGIPSIAVERGDLINLSRYGCLTVFSMRTTYRLSDVVWHREYYMEPLLRKFNAKRLHFLPNAGPSVASSWTPFSQRDIDFLWANRLIPQRKANWLAKILTEEEFLRTNNAILGFFPQPTDAGVAAEQALVSSYEADHVALHPYIDPLPVYKRAKFFVLASDIVFCNNALLEAMSQGLIPLVSDIEKAELIVPNESIGFRFEHTEDGLRQAMRKALALSSQEAERMSKAAQNHIAAEFSPQEWGKKLKSLYDILPIKNAN